MSQVGEIVWRYKLSPETINLPARDGIEEIQVFELALRTPVIAEDVLRAIDRAIPFPLVFRLVHDERIRYAAAYKRPSEADGAKWVIETYFHPKPQPLSAPRLPLPVALDLVGLYEQILRRHIPLPARKGEALADLVTRCRQVEATRKSHRQLVARLAREKQFNRKVELNAAVRSAEAELAALTT